jgi:hypothetical protein
MSICVYSVFDQVVALRRTDLPSKEPYRLCVGLGTEAKQSSSRISYAPKWEQHGREIHDVTSQKIYIIAVTTSNTTYKKIVYSKTKK